MPLLAFLLCFWIVGYFFAVDLYLDGADYEDHSVFYKIYNCLLLLVIWPFILIPIIIESFND